MNTTFTGAAEVGRFQAIVIKNAIKLYRDTGMKANRAYTPTNMRLTAEKITGKKFKARDWNAWTFVNGWNCLIERIAA